MIGYPATMDADYIQYILSDHTIIPAAYAKYYSEKIVYMPDTYFVNDYASVYREVESAARELLGLPTDKFYFVTLTSSTKSTPMHSVFG